VRKGRRRICTHWSFPLYFGGLAKDPPKEGCRSKKSGLQRGRDQGPTETGVGRKGHGGRYQYQNQRGPHKQLRNLEKLLDVRGVRPGEKKKEAKESGRISRQAIATIGRQGGDKQ